MSELVPTLQARDIRSGLVDFLSTTFSLADEEAREALTRFLEDPRDGIFKGPYVRARVPFRPAENGWRDSLDWYEGPTPYGHQARAFERLSSFGVSTGSAGATSDEMSTSSTSGSPLPTLVTTGTGSGKTEAFLYPILDHVLREKREGRGGIKALILYPMNALANDQARRLTELIAQYPALAGIRAAIYTGQKGAKRTTVTPDGLITDRAAMRADAPDILLTNYKMLDQLLLRSADQSLWQQSAHSLQYLVLDEFHTYDGAQGTDVAMLIRRLRLALRRNGGTGTFTPVATSATLGDKGDSTSMLGFAHTVFGEPFDDDAVVTETRLSVDEWAADAATRVAAGGYRPRAVDASVVAQVNSEVERLGDAGRDADSITATVLGVLFGDRDEIASVPGDDKGLLLDLVKAHPFVHELIAAASDAVSLGDLGERMLPAGLAATETLEERAYARIAFLVSVLGALSHVRFLAGRDALSIDLHLWLRALTRIDRVAGPTASYKWSDDGLVEVRDNDDPYSDEGRERFPALYCRHCGRSGWGIELAPTGFTLAADDSEIRRNHASKANSRFRALIFAPQEADFSEQRISAGEPPVEGLCWFSVRERALSLKAPTLEDANVQQGTVLPVLALMDEDAGDQSNDDMCPSCQRPDGIRFLGSAVATMLSVAITSVFADANLDGSEKKALVFTDSVQDAAHRAGFVQSRSHVFSLRNAIRAAVGDHPIALDSLVEALIQGADDRFARYRLLPPDLVDRDEFRPFWEAENARAVPASVLRKVRRRLLLDVELEFGLQSRVGRTLELTGSLAAEVDAGTPALLAKVARTTLDGFSRQAELDEDGPGDVAADTLVTWVRGVLERMRDRGAIEHEWFKKYIENDGRRWAVWGGRPRGQGMPAFPRGRDAPGYPRVGGHAVTTGPDSQKTHLDVATSTQSWFALWAKRVLHVTAADGAKLTRLLFAALEREGIVASTAVGGGSATVYHLHPSRVMVEPVASGARDAGRHLLVCDVCRNPVPGTAQVIDQLDGAPCFAARCPGRQQRQRVGQDYYRNLYDAGDMRRVVAREHTSLLDDGTRLAYENGFKAAIEQPDAPNVLVATPTLEMGIDIGDLSTVMLAGLPKSVASYLQRVGRAGRLTGNSLSLAFVEGRGEQLPKLGEPLSVINGKVRASATYLNAEEILQRQYVASLIDRRAADVDPAPRRATDVLKSAEPGTFLGDLLADAEVHHAEWVEAFLAEFDGTLDPRAADELRAWARPREEAGTSGPALMSYRAVVQWNAELARLTHRRDAVEAALPELKAAAEHPAATDDAKSELRSAESSLKMLAGLRGRLRDEPWIGALERFGVLPNYTLLDDSVQLDVALTWYDDETGAWSTGTETYERAAGIAIRELAPGAVFYAKGLEIKVDAVDLGVGGEAVERWAFCPACGFGYALSSIGTPHSTCPRCGAKAIADAAQQLDVVELEHVSAEVRRDEASISDRSDDRQRERFMLQVAADIDPAHIADRWFVDGTGFGITYLRHVDIRWINLGKRAIGGPPRVIAGDELVAPMFRVCEACGKLDAAAGANTRHEHRAWCPHRASRDEHVATIALTRTLTTQGVVFRLPVAITLGDSLAVPSLSAAIRLGLREIIGGDPDHLRIEQITEPVLSDGSENIPALLIHDTVPGGTGYLAELADHQRIRELLEAALEVVRECDCQLEGRNACHHCLLPFAPGGSADLVSRASAQRSLELLLQVDREGVVHEWAITQDDPGNATNESVIEQYFRKLFLERAGALGGAVKEIPGAWGNKIQVTLPGRTWILSPQKPLGPTTPDFVLEQFGGGAQSIAIYTDGLKYHATKGMNRVRDDAEKRRSARDLGYHVMAITWQDLERAATDAGEPPPDWFSPQLAAGFTAHFGISLSSLGHVSTNPMTALMAWMQDPVKTAQDWGGLARALPVLAMQPSGKYVESGSRGLAASVIEAFDGETGAPSGATDTWHVRRPHLVWASRFIDESGATETLLALDDREAGLGDEGYAEDWRLWLKLSNLLGMRHPTQPLQIVALSELLDGGDVAAPAPTLGAADVTLTEGVAIEWEKALELAGPDERRLLVDLTGVPGLSAPSVGIEVGDGIPIGIAWPDRHVAVDLNLDDGDRADLEASGWTLVAPDPTAIRDTLVSAG